MAGQARRQGRGLHEPRASPQDTGALRGETAKLTPPVETIGHVENIAHSHPPDTHAACAESDVRRIEAKRISRLAGKGSGALRGSLERWLTLKQQERHPKTRSG